MHIALLTSLPLFYVHGVDGAKWTQVAALNAPLDEVFGAALGTLMGAWVGAIPIPLDWYVLDDRLTRRRVLVLMKPGIASGRSGPLLFLQGHMLVMLSVKWPVDTFCKAQE